ncbi:MAG TPA: Clp protease N-terminal domain-containing protein [Candidatus Dormibacteraeota bacterium]|jgi:ATP-dependent Clp protease ATP-binding subunit ClpC
MHQYPFERFTEDSKWALSLAQEEAERARLGFIGTEHLLLGMLRLVSGSANRALASLAIDATSARKAIQIARGGKRSKVARVIPTSRVKRVVEIAFEESRRMGTQRVHSGHLLAGLAIEGEGIAAVVLKDFGATADRVVAQVERELETAERGPGTPPVRPNPPAAQTTDPFDPPPNVAALRSRLASMQLQLKHAAAARDGEHALKLAGEVNRLGEELDQAENDWHNSIDNQLR